MTKGEELVAAANGKGCLGKANDNEPVFILRGQDMLAPAVVRMWADMLDAVAKASSTKNRSKQHRKAHDARLLAARMEAWPTRKMPD